MRHLLQRLKLTKPQAGINMVDLMMWLVIAALLLAAAIQSIGYYQKASYMHVMQSDAFGAASNVMALSAQQGGKVDTATITAAVAETNWSANTIPSVENGTGNSPFLRVSHPGVDKSDVIYLFNSCGDYSAGIHTVPKAGVASCGIQESKVSGWESVALQMDQTIPTKKNWYRAGTSPDGVNLIAAHDGGYISTSKDSGATWTDLISAGSRWWMSATVSPDGKNIVAGQDGGRLVTSSDYGVTWTEHLELEQADSKWNTAAFSGDGSKVVAATLGKTGVYDGVPYISSNGGVTWNRMNGLGNGRFSSLAISNNGSTIIAAKQDDYLYSSKDGGATWTQLTGSGSRHWMDVSMSADGKNVLAVTSPGSIYSSNDYGVTWKEATVGSNSLWLAAAVSPDGSTMVAGVDGGSLWLSKDSGSTWNRQADPGVGNWNDAAINNAGKIIASQWNGYIYLGSVK